MRYDKIKDFFIEFEPVLSRQDKPAFIVKSISYNHFPTYMEVSSMFPDIHDGLIDPKSRYKQLKHYHLDELEEFALFSIDSDTTISMYIFNTAKKKTVRTYYKIDFTQIIPQEIVELFQQHIKNFIKLYNKYTTKIKHQIKQEEKEKVKWCKGKPVSIHV